MTGERAVETDCERAALDNVSDGPVAQALRSEVAVTIDGAERRAGVDARQHQPGPPRPDRAGGRVAAVGETSSCAIGVLVGLGPTPKSRQKLCNGSELRLNRDEGR
jgi:hypothetical protein